MRNVCALLALAGTAAIASAQYTMHWYWTGPTELSQANPTGTYTLWAEMGGSPLVGFAGSIFDINAGCEDCDGFISNGMGNPTLGALSNNDGTQVGPEDIIVIDAFQLPPFFNAAYDASNPIWVYTLDITATAFNGSTFTLTSLNHLNHSVYTDDFGTSKEATPTIDGLRITCVPTPASLGLIGLGGLVAARRRR